MVMGRYGYGPKWSWAEMVMGRNDPKSSARLFADDCVLYRNIKSPIDCKILQDDLNSLAQWETYWQMKFNVAKCHSIYIRGLFGNY